MISSKSRKIVFIAAVLAVFGAPGVFGAGTGKTAVIVVEGIDPDLSAGTMKEMAEFLSGMKVPFVVGVRPVVYTAAGKRTLSDNPYLVKNIRALSTMGTFLVQRTLPQGEARLDEQIGELVRHDILPLGFLDIPAVTENRNYDGISAHFSTIVREADPREAALGERFQSVISVADRFEREQAASGDPDKKIFMGVMVRPGFDRDEVLRFVQSLKKRRYAFLDLKRLPNYVRSDDLMIVSNTLHYAGMPFNSIAYGSRRKLDLMKFRLRDSFLIERVYNGLMECVSEKVFDLRLTGTALIDLPPGEAAYLVRQSAAKPGAMERVTKMASIVLFGKLSAGRLEDAFRLVVIVLFLITAVITVYIVVMFVRAMMSGRSYRGL